MSGGDRPARRVAVNVAEVECVLESHDPGTATVQMKSGFVFDAVGSYEEVCDALQLR